MSDSEIGRMNQPAGSNAAERPSDARPSHRESSQPSTEKQRPATRACDRCRQMKVRCEGFDNPPCVRCKKSGKECPSIGLLQSPNREDPPRKRSRVSEPTNGLSGSILVAQHTNPVPQWTSVQSNAPHASVSFKTPVTPGTNTSNVEGVSHTHSSSATTPTLPSIYSKTPLDPANEPDANNRRMSTFQIPASSKGTRPQGQQTTWSLASSAIPTAFDEDLKIPKRDIRGMIKIFRDKLLPYIPVLTAQEFEDADYLMETDLPLVYCICYVTARFLPGGKHLGEMLMPKVVHILSGKLNNGQSYDKDLSALRALVIVYCYANCSSESTQDTDTAQSEDILYWPAKSLVELYSLRLGLNRAAFDLETEIRAGTLELLRSTAYRKYTFWLQLFTMAQYTSFWSGTPPTIPTDSTIRAAPALIEQIGPNPHARLFGEVELAIIWQKVTSGRELGEWWCPRFPNPATDRELQSALRQGNQLIDAWYEKWEYFINDEEGRGAILDYLGRCSRFWLNNYATQHLRNSSMDLTSAQKGQIRTCLKHAIHVLDWPLDLSPIDKESLRYIPESGSIMISFCCLFILASCQTWGSLLPDFQTDLDKVDAAAQLMLDMAPHAEHSAHIQGRLIIKRTAALRKWFQHGPREAFRADPAGSIEVQVPPGISGQEPIDQMHDADLPARDMVWDFSMFLPRAW